MKPLTSPESQLMSGAPEVFLPACRLLHGHMSSVHPLTSPESLVKSGVQRIALRACRLLLGRISSRQAAVKAKKMMMMMRKWQKRKETVGKW